MMVFRAINLSWIVLASLLVFSTISQATQTAPRFNGLVRFDKICSTSIIRFHQSLKTDKALMLANAHCIRIHPELFPDHLKSAAQTVDDQKVGAFLVNFDIKNNWVYDVELVNYKKNITYKTKAKHVLYATHTLTDLALFELSETFAELETKGILSLTLSERPAKVNEKIVIVSALFDHQFVCSVDGIVPVILTNRTYFRNAVRYSKECAVYKGTSGSPVISLKTGEVVAINSFRNEPSDKNCIDAGICEVDGADVHVGKIKSGYGMEVHQIYSCLDENRKINLNKPGCKLYGSPETPN